MNRRGVFGALLGAPLAAKAAIDEGAQIVSEAPVGLGSWVVGDARVSPFAKALWRAKNRHIRLQGLKNTPLQGLSVNVATKRSWSPIFKLHVYTQDVIKEPDLFEMSEDELLAFFAKRGIAIVTES